MDNPKPQDVLVVLKLCAVAAGSNGNVVPPRPSMAVLGTELGLSASEIHAAIGRARRSGLLYRELPRASGTSLRDEAMIDSVAQIPKGRSRSLLPERPNTTAIQEFLVHGLKYVFPSERGELTRGIPTSYAAAPLSALIARGRDPIPVWPFVEGTERGVSFEPLYRTVPFAALRDPALYELLVIADALREGRARERKIAEEQLRERLDRIHVE